MLLASLAACPQLLAAADFTYFVDQASNRLARVERDPNAAQSVFYGYDAAGNLVTAFAGHVDHDGDGLTTYDELILYGTDWTKSDTDDDGLSDGEEIAVYQTNPNDADSDGDGTSDGDEVTLGRNPTVNELKVLIPILKSLE